MNDAGSVLIIGTGLAGVTAAATLREAGHTGRVVLVGDERESPYDRPPLSKAVLTNEDLAPLLTLDAASVDPWQVPASLALRAPNWFTDAQIEMRLGRAARQLDLSRRLVTLADGQSLAFDQLILAMGTRARRLPALDGGALPVCYLRTLRDAVVLRRQLTPGARVVLLGGGIIGMEVAASARKLGCEVTVIEPAPRIMSRALTEPLSAHVAARHIAEGVTLLTECCLDDEPLDGATLQLQDGRRLPADVLVVGIGVLPNIELAATAGLDCNDGIVVDEFGATSVDGVFAVGDAANYPDAFLGRRLRSETWMHAQDHAAAVARNLLGANTPYRRVPYMWSDQYNLKIQVTGTTVAARHVLRGDPGRDKFLWLHVEGRRLVGASGINESRDLKLAQRLIEAAVDIDPDRLADPGFNFKKAAEG